MESLRGALEGAGLIGVSTYLQSGNVVAETGDREEVVLKLRSGLASLGLDVAVLVRSAEEMQRVVSAGPFGNDGSDDSHRFVTFLPAPCPAKLPSRSARGDWEVLKQTDSEVYTAARIVDGRYGAPNGPIEAVFKAAATTRNWAVVRAVAELLERVKGDWVKGDWVIG